MRTNLSIALLAFGFAGATLAQDPPSFEEADRNGDGMISQEEAATVEGVDMATADRDQNGSLDREEYNAATGQE